MNKKAAISMASMKMLGNFQVGKVTQERLIIIRTFPGWTAIGVTRSRSFGFVCLEKMLCYYTRENEMREHIPVPYDNLFKSILSFSQLFLA